MLSEVEAWIEKLAADSPTLKQKNNKENKRLFFALGARPESENLTSDEQDINVTSKFYKILKKSCTDK